MGQVHGERHYRSMLVHFERNGEVLNDVWPEKGGTDIKTLTKLIKESEHPKRELGTVGDVPVVGKDVGILYTSNLREVLTSPVNLKGIIY